MSEATILKEFELAAIAHSDATQCGDYERANRNYDLMQMATALLQAHGQLEGLKAFLRHSNRGVRVSSAARLLSLGDEDAISTLEEIAGGDGIESFNAEMVLREWRNGNLTH